MFNEFFYVFLRHIPIVVQTFAYTYSITIIYQFLAKNQTKLSRISCVLLLNVFH